MSAARWSAAALALTVVLAWAALPTNAGAFTQQELLRDFVFASTFNGVDEGLDVLVEGLSAGQPYEVTLWSFDESSDGARASDWSVNGRLVEHWSFNGADISASVPTPPENKYFFSFVAAADANGRLLISGRAVSGLNTPGVFLNAMAIAQVPEPATTALLGVGAALLVPAAARRGRRRSARGNPDRKHAGNRPHGVGTPISGL